MSTTRSLDLNGLYHELVDLLGPSGWWPADSKFEILVGAILVQNTNWQNVDKSLDNLRHATNFDPQAIADLSIDALQTLIRPSGFYRNKSRTINGLFSWLAHANFDLDAVAATDPQRLRQQLLALPGIGEETADAMRLYVFDQPTFIADNYCRRLFSWLGQDFQTYAKLKVHTHEVDGWDLIDAQEFHGLIDNFGKTVKTPEDFAQSPLAQFTLTLK
ncbi:endonuclease III domain-containing protein [Lacticaseibacillus porcinae]|uniref:endonuclease III domain-containing protein n=1 Tax=Lacticaseibacillus porcinae TaxID=1123687 RepID=UPI000F7B37CA|nr:deoxyribonuclease I [Lacticaseibacillus porcinae]